MVGRPQKPLDALKPLGACIRRERERLKMSEAELAQKTKYKEQTIRNLETGHMRPSRWRFQLICEALPEVAEELLGLFEKSEVGNGKDSSGRVSGHDEDSILGIWNAMWQTLIRGARAAIVERVEITADKGSRFGLKNLDGARWLGIDAETERELPPPCLWTGFCELSPTGWLMGMFYSGGPRWIEGHIRGEYRRHEGTIVGYWMGSAYHNSHVYGALVLGGTEQDAQRCFEQENDKQPMLPLAGDENHHMIQQE